VRRLSERTAAACFLVRPGMSLCYLDSSAR
jgi:hypothetical protein